MEQYNVAIFLSIVVITLLILHHIWKRRNQQEDKKQIPPPILLQPADLEESPSLKSGDISWEALIDILDANPASRKYIMLVGPPASGKSKIAKALQLRNYIRLSMDKILEKSPLLQANPILLLAEFNHSLEHSLRSGENIVDDNLNCGKKERHKVIQQARKAGYDVVLVHMDIPLELCLERNPQRDNSVQPWKIRELWFNFNVYGLPSIREGKIIKISPLENEMIHYQFS